MRERTDEREEEKRVSSPSSRKKRGEIADAGRPGKVCLLAFSFFF
jgi:hypothetical protein